MTYAGLQKSGTQMGDFSKHCDTLVQLPMDWGGLSAEDSAPATVKKTDKRTKDALRQQQQQL
jgi:hypothetical protein